MEGSTGLCLTKIFTAKVSILSLSVSGMLGIVSSWRPEERERRKTEETEDRAREEKQESRADDQKEPQEVGGRGESEGEVTLTKA
jgi:hypothetical protein